MCLFPLFSLTPLHVIVKKFINENIIKHTHLNENETYRVMDP